MKKLKLALCIPHNYTSFQKEFVWSLLQVIEMFHKSRWNKRIILDVCSADGFSIEAMRERLANYAKDKSDLMLWMDTDMTFPPNMIAMMLDLFELAEQNGQEYEAITGLYTYKTPPFLPHVYHELDPNGSFKIGGAFHLNKPFEVKGAGFGCIMIKTEVLKRIKPPYFELVYDETGSVKFGEDMSFCKKANMKMLCDPRIVCGHYYNTGYDIGSYLEYNGLKVNNDGMIEMPEDKKIQIWTEFESRKKAGK